MEAEPTLQTSATGAQVRIGIVGLGYAGRAMADAVSRSRRFHLAAVVDRSPERQAGWAARGVAVEDDLDDLLARDVVEVVYVATPTVLHHNHALRIAASGRHAVVEKPMATELQEADEVVRAFADRGLVLVVGHSHGFDLPTRELRAVAEEGRFGALISVHNWCFTDWTLRPRKPEDVDRALGGGVSLRQGAHQFDMLRSIAGGAGTRLHATSVPIPGARGDASYSALVEFEGGCTATAVYGGRGGFDSRILSFGVGEAGESIERVHPWYPHLAAEGSPRPDPMFGLTIAAFESADVVPSPWGLLVHQPGQSVEEVRYRDRGSGWDALLVELAAALDGEAVLHSGPWGVATLEMCLAVGESARTKEPVELVRQVAAPAATSPVEDRCSTP